MTMSISIRGAVLILWAGLAGLAVAADSAPVPAPAPAPVAGGFDLVTESEVEAWNSAPKETNDFQTRDPRDDTRSPTCKSTADNDADNPKIRVIAPTLEKPLLPPFDIELQFTRAGNSPIRPETLRICYVGMVTMDITKRVTDRATLSESGLRLSGAQMPHGHHRLLLIVADQRGRLARREAVFNVL
jgi:hypothetical protein